jgi:hypothetical protein
VRDGRSRKRMAVAITRMPNDNEAVVRNVALLLALVQIVDARFDIFILPAVQYQGIESVIHTY